MKPGSLSYLLFENSASLDTILTMNQKYQVNQIHRVPCKYMDNMKYKLALIISKSESDGSQKD